MLALHTHRKEYLGRSDARSADKCQQTDSYVLGIKTYYNMVMRDMMKEEFSLPAEERSVNSGCGSFHEGPV